MRVAVLMPAREEASVVATTLRALARRGEDVGGVCVYLVDDGSEPALELGALPPATDGFEVALLRHVVNLGQGAALETARKCALVGEHEVFVTMDADGQHDPADLAALVAAIDAGNDAAFGNRFTGKSRVPAGRAVLLHAARVFELALTGRGAGDAHNGYRAFSRAGLSAIAIEQSGMAHATEIRARAQKSRLRVVEVPVTIQYTGASLAKGQSPFGALRIVQDLFVRWLVRS
jgi:glycosyltransferase involved in cell wall biosynthesis